MAGAIWVATIILLILAYRRTGSQRRRGGGGPAAAGAVYDWLNEDKRNAVQIIVEGRAEARDPEDADGNLPDLEDPARTRRKSHERQLPSCERGVLDCLGLHDTGPHPSSPFHPDRARPRLAGTAGT